MEHLKKFFVRIDYLESEAKVGTREPSAPTQQRAKVSRLGLLKLKAILWADEMAQGVKALAAKPASLSSVSGTSVMEGETGLPQVVL